MAEKGRFPRNRRLQTIHHNNDVSVNDIETADFNSDTQMTDLNDIDKLNLKKTPATQHAAKKISINLET